jgi:hypothetical protein
MISPESLPGLIDGATGIKPFAVDSLPRIGLSSDGSLHQEETTKALLAMCRWLPNHGTMKTIFHQGMRAKGLTGDGTEWNLRSVGRILAS